MFNVRSLISLILIGASTYALCANATPTDKAPLTFLENRGQVVNTDGKPQPDILYVLKHGGMTVFVRENGLSYQLVRDLPEPAADEEALMVAMKKPAHFEHHRFDVELLGASDKARVSAEGADPYYEIYYLPQCAQGARANAFGSVIVHDVYPNIDWVLHANADGLKYDFIVREGGDPSRIRMKYSGMDAIALDPKGDLRIETHLGPVMDSAPVVSADRTSFTSRFTLTDDGVVGIAIDGLAAGKACVIDPSVSWAGYYGTSGLTEYGNSVVTDASGNVYMSGITDTPGAILNFGFGTSFNGGLSDWYLVKWGPNGAPRIWAIYYGSTDNDGQFSIPDSGTDTKLAITSAALYFTGTTHSSAGAPFSTINTGAGACAGFQAFLIRFDLNGNRIWSRYYGGNLPCGGGNYEAGLDVAANENSLYMTGISNHTNTLLAPVQVTTFQGGVGDAYLAKFNPANGSIIWDRYIGIVGQPATEEDAGLTVALDAQENPVVGGYTRSTQGFAVNAWQTTLSGTQDGFLAKFDQNTGATIWSTYYGGPTGGAADYLRDLAIDECGNNYIVGNTTSSAGIASCAYQTTLGGGMDAFLTKFSPNGLRLWGTYFGGSGNDWGFGVCVDPQGSPYITGNTWSTSGIYSNGLTNYNGLNFAVKNGLTDAFVARFTPTGQRIWSSYYGTSGGEVGNALVHDVVTSQVFVCGLSTATGLATAGQWTYAGGNDAFIAKIDGNFAFGGPVTLKARAILGGAQPIDASCNMTKTLRLPLGQPYCGLGFGHSGTESATNTVLNGVGSNIVDWVLVELRDPASPCKVIASRAALITKDGWIVDTDGFSVVTFNAPSGNYKIAVRHRNHLGIMTQNAYAFVIGGATVGVDMRDPAVTMYTAGGSPRMSLSCGKMALWPGNARILDQQPERVDYSLDPAQILARLGGNPMGVINGVYLTEDVNMNFITNYNGAGNDRDFILAVPLGGCPGCWVTEQLPY